jgi:hypothetical protein
MTTTLKSNDNLLEGRQTHKCEDAFQGINIILPLPPEDMKATYKAPYPQTEGRAEMEIYARFMRHLRLVPNSKEEIKVLSAIQFTADMLDISDALIAKTLVDLGLRAPRSSFPAEYLDFIDKTLLRSGWQVGGPTASSAELKAHWDEIGEDKFAAYRGEPVMVERPMFVDV